jgi:hypothetical protein
MSKLHVHIHAAYPCCLNVLQGHWHMDMDIDTDADTDMTWIWIWNTDMDMDTGKETCQTILLLVLFSREILLWTGLRGVQYSTPPQSGIHRKTWWQGEILYRLFDFFRLLCTALCRKTKFLAKLIKMLNIFLMDSLHFRTSHRFWFWFGFSHGSNLNFAAKTMCFKRLQFLSNFTVLFKFLRIQLILGICKIHAFSFCVFSEYI